MAIEQKPVTFNQGREQETKNWVYDLIKGEGEFVFVAEVTGPEDKIAVRLVDGISICSWYRRIFKRSSN